jgi:hypothetical protein
MHIVEVHRIGDDLVEPMGQMHNWFDAQRIVPGCSSSMPARFAWRSRPPTKPQLLPKRLAGE